MEALGDERVVVRYDQLGAGKSDHVTDTALFNLARFVGELEALRAHLGLARIHLYGHSWGSVLAFEYYRAYPKHVASLILASDVLDMPAYRRNRDQLMAALRDSIQFGPRYGRTRRYAPRWTACSERQTWRLPSTWYAAVEPEWAGMMRLRS